MFTKFKIMNKLFYNKYILIIFLGTLFIFSESCTKDFDEINANPQQAPALDAAQTLAWSQVSLTGHRFESWRSNLLGASYYAQMINTPWADYDGCMANDGWNSALWNTAYTKLVGNINLTIQLAEENSNEGEAAIAQIWKALIFHRLTDYYGDIPYSESGLSIQDAVFTPKYETQETIYKDLLSKLEAATSKLSEGGNSFGEGDLIYQGDHSQWIKFANSLRLRLAMRISDVDPGLAGQHISAVMNNVMASNDDSAIVPHEGTGQFDFQSNGTSAPVVAGFNGHWPSKALVDRMNATNDPRRSYYYTQNASGEYVGLRGGTVDADVEVNADNYSSPNIETLFSMEADAVVMSYSEVEYLLAEAVLKGWASGDAEGHYKNGLMASCERSGIEAADIEAFLSEEGIVFDSDKATEQILTQLWIDLYPNGYEAWASWRRTGIPVFSSEEADEGIPRRAVYPQLEKVLNATNYESAVSVQGADIGSTRVWWDR